ncbi:hypothetical protein ACFL6I_23135 [candidate division KSB1 bacterium]
MNERRKEKLSVNHAEAFVAATRETLGKQLGEWHQERSEDHAEREALFYNRLDYFVEKVETLMSFVERMGGQLMHISAKDLYTTLLGKLKLGEEEGSAYFAQNTRLKLVCLKLIESRETVLKYSDYANKDPQGFIENEILTDAKVRPSSLVGRIMHPSVKGAKVVENPFCFGIFLKDKDFEKLTGYNPDIYSAMAIPSAKNPELDQRVYLSTFEHANTDPDYARHEEMHLVYYNFVGHHNNYIFKPNEILQRREGVAEKVHDIVSTKKAHYLSLFQTEVISNASQDPPVIYSHLGQYGVDSFLLSLELIAKTIAKHKGMDDSAKKDLLKDLQDEFIDYTHESQQYLQTVRHLCHFSNLSQSRLVALLLSTPMGRLRDIANHYDEKNETPNPIWEKIENNMMHRRPVHWWAEGGGTKRAYRIEGNDKYEDEAWEKALKECEKSCDLEILKRKRRQV